MAAAITGAGGTIEAVLHLVASETNDGQKGRAAYSIVVPAPTLFGVRRQAASLRCRAGHPEFLLDVRNQRSVVDIPRMKVRRVELPVFAKNAS